MINARLVQENLPTNRDDQEKNLYELEQPIRDRAGCISQFVVTSIIWLDYENMPELVEKDLKRFGSLAECETALFLADAGGSILSHIPLGAICRDERNHGGALYDAGIRVVE